MKMKSMKILTQVKEEREEIRWKFQMMMENLEMIRKQLDIKIKPIDGVAKNQKKDINRIRSYWLAGIGFFMTVYTLVILTEPRDDIHFIFPIAAGIIGSIIFFESHRKLNTMQPEFRESAGTHYYFLNNLLDSLKEMLYTHALIENYSKDNFLVLTTYVTLVGKAISYQCTRHLDKELHWPQFSHESFRDYHDLAKLSLDNLKKMNYSLGTSVIEQFVKDFEKDEKIKGNRGADTEDNM